MELKQSGLNYVIIRAAPYYQTLLLQTRSVLKSGNYCSTIKQDTQMAMIDLADVGTAVSKIIGDMINGKAVRKFFFIPFTD